MSLPAVNSLAEVLASEKKSVTASLLEVNTRVGSFYLSTLRCWNLHVYTLWRSAYDKETNHQGSILYEFMFSNGFILLNGRIPGDHNGGSPLVMQEVIVHCSHSSFHPTYRNSAALKRVMCSSHLLAFLCAGAPSSAHSYKKSSMFVSPLIALKNFATALTNDLNHALQKAIMNAARDAGMLKLLNSQPKSRNRYISKPWHDDECRAKKKQTKTLLYHCKLEGQIRKTYLELQQCQKPHDFLVRNQLGERSYSTSSKNEIPS
ncbi:hypothetical protein KQX54_012198 [Cotesia glomerata]|uniref:Uncharacterized protein n=1 Tax=Cotesia glomerata TaxID=32391 RepID=A0AAV7HJS1_COTGL|nr:hypothetical protein KQX54_012198 [Cotesia glomerata]